MNPNLFQAGDRVRHGDEGPIMQVESYNKAGKVVCSWYQARSGWKQKTFDEKTLRRVGRARSYAK